jgi:hypothetical protein
MSAWNAAVKAPTCDCPTAVTGASYSWHMPKRGDTVRCVKLPGMEYGYDTCKLTIGKTYAVNAPTLVITTRSAGKALELDMQADPDCYDKVCKFAITVTSDDGIRLPLPLDCFEPA